MKFVLYVLQMIGTNSPGSNPKVQKNDLGGGFKYFYFQPLSGEYFHFDSYFSDGLKPPTSDGLNKFESLNCMPLESDGVFVASLIYAPREFHRGILQAKNRRKHFVWYVWTLWWTFFQVKCKGGSPRKQN